MGFQVVLNHPHTRRLGRRHNTKSLSRLTRSTGAPNTMHIGIGISRQFEVNHHFQGGNIEPSGRDIAGHQNRAGIVCELQKHLIAISLLEVARRLGVVLPQLAYHSLLQACSRCGLPDLSGSSGSSLGARTERNAIVA